MPQRAFEQVGVIPFMRQQALGAKGRRGCKRKTTKFTTALLVYSALVAYNLGLATNLLVCVAPYVHCSRRSYACDDGLRIAIG